MTERTRSRGAWTKEKLAYLHNILAVLEELRDWWPVTLRQAYYRLVANQKIENCNAEYKKVSKILAQARLDGLAPWDAIEDRGRRTIFSHGWDESPDFVREQVDDFLVGYRRDLLVRQPHAVEVWIEKDALAEVARRAASELCVPVVVARGYSSVSYVDQCRKRIESNVESGQHVTKVLYFRDLDPSGWSMLPSMLVTLRDEMHLGDHVEGIRCALTPEQVVERRLPYSVEALKMSDSRTPAYQEWLREQGHDDTIAVELDALAPAELDGLVRDSILAHLDPDQLAADRAQEELDRDQIDTLRGRVLAVVGEVAP